MERWRLWRVKWEFEGESKECELLKPENPMEDYFELNVFEKGKMWLGE